MQQFFELLRAHPLQLLFHLPAINAIVRFPTTLRLSLILAHELSDPRSHFLFPVIHEISVWPGSSLHVWSPTPSRT
jgi:hypothetical protein